MMILDLLRSDGSITVNKNLIQAIGLNEAVLYCELLSRYFYFEARQLLDDEGCFYNTQYDLQAGTGLGEKAQRTAINNLKSLGLIEVKRKGMPAKRYFKIIQDENKITLLLKEGKKRLESLANSADTSIGGNLKRPRKELDTAKGSGNNTKNNTKEIIQRLNVVIANRNDDSFFLDVFNYYLTKYELYMKKQHPILSNKYISQIVKAIDDFGDEYDLCKVNDWKLIIDMYFKSNLDSDRNMIHFAQEEILYNRADNCRLV
ncbi:hypothetical protein [Tissierella sp.]|uniref:hypothetical protein n=1 Tax=Tissierella sp. TaxID=41274 RepID=UPI0028657A56|nr:hypothetical protein [Tissierella sp.]MDR7856101.1 hypothetical protein [Tissierella sp.]